ncbi:PLP-dependent transferase [Haematococcus lacustris]
MSTASILQERRQRYGPNTSLNYSEPLHLVRGRGCYLYDAEGQEYLDCVNNVAHCGHAHPKVAAAVSQQLHTLNTNSRYLHSGLTQYTRALISTMPPELQVLYMVCSGSEANDLALRVAAAARPGATHVVVMGGAYHGHTGALIQLSPYKFWGKGGGGKASHVHVIPCPDPYRGEHLDGGAAARAAIAEARAAGGRVCAFFAESILSCGGQVVMPPGYLKAVYEEMRREGAVCVADEVQCGFGRVGCAFWGFQTQQVVPDIVTMGKPMGNGYPVAGVVMRRELAAAFDNGMEYFNTCGGSTAQTAACLAVLHTTWAEGLQEQAEQVGHHLLRRLQQEVVPAYPCVGDARGLGLMLGLDCVVDKGSKAHAPCVARWIKERCKARRVLLSCDGPYDNVVKMKPPLVFGLAEADRLVGCISAVLREELTPGTWASLMAAEGQAWALLYGPRMALYGTNAAQLGLLTQTIVTNTTAAEEARAAALQASLSLPADTRCEYEPAKGSAEQPQEAFIQLCAAAGAAEGSAGSEVGGAHGGGPRPRL